MDLLRALWPFICSILRHALGKHLRSCTETSVGYLYLTPPDDHFFLSNAFYWMRSGPHQKSAPRCRPGWPHHHTCLKCRDFWYIQHQGPKCRSVLPYPCDLISGEIRKLHRRRSICRWSHGWIAPRYPILLLRHRHRPGRYRQICHLPVSWPAPSHRSASA